MTIVAPQHAPGTTFAVEHGVDLGFELTPPHWASAPVSLGTHTATWPWSTRSG